MSTGSLEDIRQALRTYRLEQRLSYAQLGAEMGLSMPAVRDFVLGNTEPHETTVYVVTEFLSKVKAA